MRIYIISLDGNNDFMDGLPESWLETIKTFIKKLSPKLF